MKCSYVLNGVMLLPAQSCTALGYALLSLPDSHRKSQRTRQQETYVTSDIGISAIEATHENHAKSLGAAHIMNDDEVISLPWLE